MMLTKAAVRIKICGITSVADAEQAVRAGADAIGLVFYAASPRAVSLELARDIAYAAGPFVTSVGLFVNADRAFIEQVVKRVPLQLLQFHGEESAEFCEQFQRPYIKAVRMRPELDMQQVLASHRNAVALLLDAYRPGIPGGTGETFDWQRVPKNPGRPLVLAGGLTPENIASAVSSTEVYGVDVSGGVESVPGRKDPQKITTFIGNARRA